VSSHFPYALVHWRRSTALSGVFFAFSFITQNVYMCVCVIVGVAAVELEIGDTVVGNNQR
jgi:hypothetical protein